MSVIIPKVQVPMDFGVQYLGSPAHSNLKFVLESGEDLLANSMIISYNSPVIENLTTNLFQSSIEVQDFSRDAVQCFLEASYSGDIKKISRSNFRDVNKMGHVFEVSWIVDRCYKYFESLTEAVEAVNDFTNQLYVFEEALFVFTRLKKRSLVDLVIKKFSSVLSCTRNFVTEYLRDLSSCSTTSLDVILEITGKEEDILIRVLVNHLENNKSVIDPNTRYLLERLKFTSCRSADKSLYGKLIEKLEGIENPCKEDFKLVVGVFKQYNNASFESKESMKEIMRDVPNLFNDFQQIQECDDLETLTTFLINSPIVTNSYMFYDAVFCWLFDKDIDWYQPFVKFPDSVVDKFSDIMSNRGWSPLPREYIDTQFKRSWCCFGGLTDQIMTNSNLITDHQYKRIASVSEYSVDELFGKNHDIKFHFKPDVITNCNKAGDCGFILRVTAASGKQDDSFNIQLVIDPDLYPEDIHFHEEVSSMLRNCHLSLDIIDQYKHYYKDMPVAWSGKPCRDGTNRYWCWGAHRFYWQGEGQPPPGNKYKEGWHCGDDVKIRLVVYFHS